MSIEEIIKSASALTIHRPQDKYAEMVSEMRMKNEFFKICEEEKDILKKCVLCRYNLSSNQWSVLLEKYVKTLYNINKSSCTEGDGCSLNGLNVEIKVSLGAENGQLHFVQIRPDHNVDYYLMLAYNLHENALGKVYWLLAKSNDLYDVIPEFGGYAHGTIEKLGRITNDNLKGRNCEYALRPSPTASIRNKSRKLWETMLERCSTTEEDIKIILGTEAVLIQED